MSCEKPDIPLLKLRLAQAEMALHKLLTGEQSVSVTFGPSKSVTYAQSQADELRRYIADLRDQIDRALGCSKGRRPVRMVF